MNHEEFYIKNNEMLREEHSLKMAHKAKLNLLQDQRKETAFCPDCIVAKYPPCDEHIPCCKCEKKQNECNSWQPCPKKEGKEE